MIKALLFDVDGVLAVGGSFTTRIAAEHGITREMLQPFFRGPFIACRNGEADLKEALQTRLPEWGWQGSVDTFLQYWFAAEHIIDEQLVEYIQNIRKRGIPCYLATNQEQYRTAYILEQMGFVNKFDGMFSSAYIGCGKEDSAFFAHILRKLEIIQAQEILFWDDSLANIEIARQAGLQAEQYSDFASFRERMHRLFTLQ